MMTNAILAAVDASSVAEVVVDRAVELAWKASAQLWLVHVIGPGTKDKARSRAVAERMLSRLSLRVPQARRGGTVVVAGSVPEQILEVARRHEARAVVIGRRRWADPAAGATAATLVDRLDRPLLVAHPRAVLTGHATSATELRELAARLEGWATETIEAHRAGDARAAHAHWRVFEPLLRFVLGVEEARYLPRFHEDDAVEAEALLAEHGALRASLEEIGLDVDRGALPLEAIERLRAAHQAHAARDERRFYAWIEEQTAVREAA